MFNNTWKIRQELCKVYKIYNKKAKSYLHSYSYNAKVCDQLYDIKYAIAYVLCEYFDLNYEFYYDNPFSYKWDIAWDYMNHYDECKEAYYKAITKQNKTNYNVNYNVVESIDGCLTYNKSNYSKGDIIYDTDHRHFYYYDGKNFIEMY